MAADQEALCHEQQVQLQKAGRKVADYLIQQIQQMQRSGKHLQVKKGFVPTISTPKPHFNKGAIIPPGLRRRSSYCKPPQPCDCIISEPPKATGIVDAISNALPYAYLTPATSRIMKSEHKRHVLTTLRMSADPVSSHQRVLRDCRDADHRLTLLLRLQEKESNNAVNRKKVAEGSGIGRACRSAIRDKRILVATLQRLFQEYHLQIQKQEAQHSFKDEMLALKLSRDAFKEHISQIRDTQREQNEHFSRPSAHVELWQQEFETYVVGLLTRAQEHIQEAKKVVHEEKVESRRLAKERKKKLENDLVELRGTVRNNYRQLECYRELDADAMRNNVHRCSWDLRSPRSHCSCHHCHC